MLGMRCSKFAYAQARKVGIFELGGKHILRGSSLLMFRHGTLCVWVVVNRGPLTR